MDFDDHVQRAIEGLPPELRRALVNVALFVSEEEPPEPGLYGLYEGVPLPEREGGAPLEPDTITIYRRELEADFPAGPELEDEIRITVLHELAHYFGIDEDRLDELGYG
jgi:predicted Zn-dependent protease with MMP-like domain